MILQILVLAFLSIAVALPPSIELSSPCPDVFQYENNDIERNEWYGVIKWQTFEKLIGVWITVKLDNKAELLGNWLGESYSTDNKEYRISNPDYIVDAGPPVSIRFFVKYNQTTGPIPRLEMIILNGKIICAPKREIRTTTPKLHISKTKKTTPIQHDQYHNIPTDDQYFKPASDNPFNKPNMDDHYMNLATGDHYIRPTTDDHYIKPAINDHYMKPATDNHYIKPATDDQYIKPTTENIYIKPSSRDPYFKPAPVQDAHSRPIDAENTLNGYVTSNKLAGGSDGPYNPSAAVPIGSNSASLSYQSSVNVPNGGVGLSNYKDPARNQVNDVINKTVNRPMIVNNRFTFYPNNQSIVTIPTVGEDVTKDFRPNYSQNTNNYHQTKLTSTKSKDRDSEDDFFQGDFNILKVKGQEELGKKPHLNTLKNVGCGTVASRPSALISYGQDTIPGQWPWHGAIYHTKGIQLVYICGSSLISERYVLTAAHCVTLARSNKKVNPEEIIVYFGKHNLKSFGPEIQDRTVSEIFVHPEFNFSVYYNDIAIIKLLKPIEITDYVRPCCLWGDSTTLETIINQEGTVIGWGFDEHKKISEKLMQARMPIVSTINCIYSNRDFFAQFTFDKNYCAGFRNGTSVCNGDSGGSMVFPKKGTTGQNTVWQIRGIVSVGVALQTEGVCDTSQYIIFTDVAKHLRWIKQIINLD